MKSFDYCRKKKLKQAIIWKITQAGSSCKTFMILYQTSQRQVKSATALNICNDNDNYYYGANILALSLFNNLSSFFINMMTYIGSLIIKTVL